jgi:hypothetical protein
MSLDLPDVHAMTILPENKIIKNYERVFIGDSVGNLRILHISSNQNQPATLLNQQEI